MELSVSTISTSGAKPTPTIPKFLFFIPVTNSYAYTSCFCFSVGKGVELFCCYDVFQSFQTLIFIFVMEAIDQRQDDPRLVFRILQILYAVPAILALYGIEKDYLLSVTVYYYVKIFELVVTLLRYIMLFAAGKCAEGRLANYVLGYCYTEVDILLMIVFLVLTLYETFLLFSYVNLVELGQKAKAMQDSGIAKQEPVPVTENLDKLELEMPNYGKVGTSNISEMKGD